MHPHARAATALLIVSALAAAAAEFHVAPGGNDAWSGRLAAPSADGTDGPFATPARARDAARAAAGREPVTVRIHAGVHALAGPLRLGPEDSGSPAHPVVWTGAGGGPAVLSGGRRIAGLRPGAGGRWTADLPDVREGRLYFHQLFVDGRRAVRARIPNEGWLRTTGPLEPYKKDKVATRGVKEIRMGFRFREGDLKASWTNPKDITLFLYHSWTASLHWLDSIDEAGRAVRFSNPSGWPVGWWENEQRYRVENVREGLDAPGEWYLDRAAGRLEYIPRPGEDPARVEVVAPVLDQLLVIDGDWAGGRPVHDIVFRGLAFHHADWAFSNRTDPVDGQAAVALRAAVDLRGSLRVAFEDCEIAHVGTYAIDLGPGCRSNRIERCHLHDLGAGGIKVGEFSRQSTPAKSNTVAGAATPQFTAEGAGPRDTGHTTIDNCFIHDGGHVFPAGVGVIVGHSAFNQISRNEICDLFYSAVSVGWVWGFGKSAAHHNRITGNHLHHIGWGVLSDMGGVYTLGPSPGTVVAHNHIHHVNSYSYGGWGLYTDEGSSEIVMEDNLVHDTKSGGFHQHYGRGNLIRNNILAFSREAQVQRSREDLSNSVIFVRNLVYCDNDRILIRAWRNGDYHVNSNVYWTTAPSEALFDNRDWDEWRATSGQDADSLLADPMFVDPAARDFRLRPGSPAEKIGFRPVGLAGIGLHGDPAWVALPTTVKRPEFVLPATAERSDKGIDEDFESTAADDKAPRAQTAGEGGGAQARVVDDMAASGRHSLRFTDAAGLSASHCPMISWPLNFRKGVARASFDVRMEPGAIFWHEWRDAASPYHAGPSVRIGAAGDVMAGKRKLGTVPHGAWVHVEISCPLGAASTGLYDLRLTPAGGTAQVHTNLPAVSKEFRKFQWIGFISAATNPATFHIDNVVLSAGAP
jgi:hypothetical protein